MILLARREMLVWDLKSLGALPRAGSTTALGTNDFEGLIDISVGLHKETKKNRNFCSLRPRDELKNHREPLKLGLGD